MRICYYVINVLSFCYKQYFKTSNKGIKLRSMGKKCVLKHKKDFFIIDLFYIINSLKFYSSRSFVVKHVEEKNNFIKY